MFQPPLAVTSVAHYHQPPGRHPVPVAMTTTQHRVEVVTDGQGELWHQDRWIPVGPGDLLWHGPGEMTIGRSHRSNPYRCLAVEFRMPPHTPAPVPRLSRWEAVEEIRALTRQAVRSFVDDRFDRAALAAWLYGRLRYQAALSHHHRSDADLPTGLQRVLVRIETDYARNLSLPQLAETAGWSVPHLHAVFRHHTGKSPHQALIERRLQAVRERLTGSNDGIKQISRSCGFRDAAALCRRFRQAMGVSPAAYRRRHTLPVEEAAEA